MAKVNISLVDLSRAKVRYNGRVLDKCGLSSLIHDVALIAKDHYVGCTLYTDIYWDTITYNELREYLIKWISKVK